MLSNETLLENRYRIVRPLGRGGMGAVYEAFDERLSRTVALKETLVEADELRRAFEREARLLANLRHPALPKVLDHFSEEAGLFLVMEFIPGDDFGMMLEQGRLFAPAEVLQWADQLLGALEYLHTLDPPVLHRDIKPSNLKLISPTQIILLDFGLAKGAAGQMTRTLDKSVLGYSPNYSSLEQIQGTGTDQRSDLYALAATLYHLMTGVKPPDALTRATALVNGQLDPLRPVHELNQRAPSHASAALMRAMALNIEHRPRTASEMRHDLHNMTRRVAATVPIEEVDETTQVSLRANPTGAIKTGTSRKRQPGPPVVISLPEETWVVQKQRSSGWKWMIGVSSIVMLFVLTAVLYLSRERNPTTTRTQVDRRVVSHRPSPTPVVNTNQPDHLNNLPDNLNSQPEIRPDELVAREKLVQKKIPFNEETFTRAVEEGDTNAVDLFLAAGMVPDVKDANGRTALINAASRGSDHISQKLLSKGADVNAKDNLGSTALMEASAHGHQDTSKVLLDHGAEVDLQDNNEQTALLKAAAQGHTAIVRMLINQGAKIDLKDKDGRDALMWAEINNHPDVIALLKKAGATEP